MARSSYGVILRLNEMPSPDLLLAMLASPQIRPKALMRLRSPAGKLVCEVKGNLPEHFFAHYDTAKIEWNGAELLREALPAKGNPYPTVQK